MPDPIRVALIDDHTGFRDAVADTLTACAGVSVVGLGATADDAVRLAAELLPELVLLDLHMPGGGIHAVRRIVATCPTVKAVLFTAAQETEHAIEALRAGARGYILKGIGARDLCHALVSAARGDLWISPGIASELAKAQVDLRS